MAQFRAPRGGAITRIGAGVLAAALLTGCGSRTDSVGPANPSTPEPVRAPYSGPLYVAPPPPAVDENGEPLESSGAAGLVVECRTEVIGVFDAGDARSGAAAATPEEGLREGAFEYWVEGPIDQLVVNRDDGDRVLMTRTYQGRIIQATVMRDGASIDGTLGWYAESSARCDWAEFPESDWPAGLRVWTDSRGVPVSTKTLAGWTGPEHCNWQSMTFLALEDGQLRGGRTYVGGDHGPLVNYFDEPYVARTTLPPDAVDSGYRHEGRTLWFSADRMRAYVGTDPDAVELWPKVTSPLACD